jgi:hypothetical protein
MSRAAITARWPLVGRSRGPSEAELTQLLETLSWRIVRLLERLGLLIADPEVRLYERSRLQLIQRDA